MKYYFLTFLTFLFSFSSSAQQISSLEKKIIEEVNKDIPKTLDALKTVININSGTFNVEGVRKVGDFFRQEFGKIGFTSEWISLPDSLKRAGHLFAYKKGKSKKRILMIGHLDTVFDEDQPFSPFTIVNDSTATGQGVVDMKGGVIIMLASLQALYNLDLLKDADIGIYLTCDEEVGGRPIDVSRADLVEKSKNYNIALGFESGKINTVVSSRRGSSTWKLKVTGKQGHSSSVFSKKNGYGAIFETARILDSFQVAFSKIKNVTVSPGTIAGGTEVTRNDENLEVYGRDNVIASNCLISGDLRYLTEKQKEKVRKKMTEFVSSNNLPETKAEISFFDGIPSMEPKDSNKTLLQVLSQINQELGLGEVKAGNPAKRGAGDISFVAKNMACLDGLGSSGKGAHTLSETLNIKEFPFMVARISLLTFRLINSK